MQGYRHLQPAHKTAKQIKTPRSFPENSFAVTPQPVTSPSLCSLAPETSALKFSGSTLQTNELKCPSNSMTDNTRIYCLPLLLIFVLAFTSYEQSWFCQLRKAREQELRPRQSQLLMGLQSPQPPAPEELSLVPWPNSTWPDSLLKTKTW